jgi:hypothetical protein
MLSDQQKKDSASMRVEILDLDVCANFFIRKINRFADLWQNTSRAFILEELTALRYLENGIILHLTNLDDEDSNYSFRAVQTAYNKSSKDSKAINDLKETLKTFRKNLNLLKVKHRNSRIAHLNYDKDLQIDQFLNFGTVLLPVILEANAVADQLWGEKINVTFNLGSWEGILDFKSNIDQLKMDVNAIKGFTSNKLMGG